MKRIFYAVLAFIFSIMICGCSSVYVYFDEYPETAGTVVVLPSASLPEFSDIDETALGNTETDLIYKIMQTDTAAAQYRAFCTAAKKSSTAALVVELSSTVFAAAMADTANEYDLPLIFCGKRPASAVMKRYDNSWYVGFDPALAAELQAGIITEAYRGDIVTDQSGDYKLSALVTGTKSAVAHHIPEYANTLLQIIELSGAHTVPAAEPITASDSESVYTLLDTLLLPQKQLLAAEISGTGEESTEPVYEILAPAAHTELILCADLAASNAVLDLLNSLQNAAEDPELSAYATPARRYFVAAYGIDETVTQAVKDGRILGAVGKDPAACTQVILDLCENLARKEAITKNNDYHFNDGKYLMLDYRVITTGTEAAQ